MRALGWLAMISVVLSGCASAPLQAPRQARAFEPWSPSRLEDRAHPALSARALAPPPLVAPSATAGGALQAAAWVFWRGYARVSRFNGDVCQFSPTCSRFGWEATRDHGLPGVILTFARLLRTHDHSFYRGGVRRGVEGYLLDPVEGYLFFWRQPSIEHAPHALDAAHGWHEHVRALQRAREVR